MSQYYMFRVDYLDDRMRKSRSVEVEAKDESEAYDLACEDYYFGKLLSIDCLYEIQK